MFGGEATAFFLVEEDEGVGRKAFALGGGGSGGGILLSKLGWRGVSGFDLGFGAAVGQDEEAEALSGESGAFASPGVVSRARWVGEPEAGEVEVAAEGGKGGVAGVEVAVEADVGFGSLGVG